MVAHTFMHQRASRDPSPIFLHSKRVSITNSFSFSLNLYRYSLALSPSPFIIKGNYHFPLISLLCSGSMYRNSLLPLSSLTSLTVQVYIIYIYRCMYVCILSDPVHLLLSLFSVVAYHRPL